MSSLQYFKTTRTAIFFLLQIYMSQENINIPKYLVFLLKTSSLFPEESVLYYSGLSWTWIVVKFSDELSIWLLHLQLSNPVDIGDMNWVANPNSFVVINILTWKTTNATGQGL